LDTLEKVTYRKKERIIFNVHVSHIGFYLVSKKYNKKSSVKFHIFEEFFKKNIKLAKVHRLHKELKPGKGLNNLCIIPLYTLAG